MFYQYVRSWKKNICYVCGHNDLTVGTRNSKLKMIPRNQLSALNCLAVFFSGFRDFNNYIFYLFSVIVHVCVYTHVHACAYSSTHHCTCEAREQLVGPGSLLLPSGFQDSNMNHEAWQQVPLPTEPSPKFNLLSLLSVIIFGCFPFICLWFSFHLGMVRPTDEEKVACYSQFSKGVGMLYPREPHNVTQGWWQKHMDAEDCRTTLLVVFERKNGQRNLSRLSWLKIREFE